MVVESAITPVEPLLVEEIRAYRRSWRMGALTLAATLAVIVAMGALTLGRKDALQAALLAIVLGVPAVALLFVASLGNPAEHKALRALRSRSHTVVWIYTRLFHGSMRQDEIVFNFEDGSIRSIPVDPARSHDRLARVATCFPRATIGFTPEAMATFMRAPSELYRATPQAIAAPPKAPETAWLLPFAAEHHRSRRWVAALGVLLVLLGGLGIVIVAAAASPRDQPALLIGMLALTAVLPGVFITRWSLAPFAHTDLGAALHAPRERVRTVEVSHQANVEGDYVDVAIVTLRNGRTFVFPVNPRMKPSP